MTLTVEVQRKLFTLVSFNDWRNHARKLMEWSREQHGILPARIVMVDAKGRICASGREFQRADEEDAFPVTAWEI